jgi:hypothetical protein
VEVVVVEVEDVAVVVELGPEVATPPVVDDVVGGVFAAVKKKESEGILCYIFPLSLPLLEIPCLA